MSKPSLQNQQSIDDQEEILIFLSDADTYGLPVGSVSRIDTHISHVFLAGPFAYKLKKALVLPYLNFSTVSRRRKTCEIELRINRRTAPDMYLDVVPVTRQPNGRLQLAGDGQAVDWLVKMLRFDNATLFRNLAERRQLTEPLTDQLAAAIADFHGASEVIRGGFEPNRTGALLDVNLASFRAHGRNLISAQQARSLTRRTHQVLEQQASLLKKREDDGRLRHCHGDLHLANICLFHGKPTLFDALEFNLAFAEIDVFYDLAFLLMDFDHWHLRPLGNRTLNRYLDSTGDLEGLQLLPLFLSLRAAVRSHVTLAQIPPQGPSDPDLRRDVELYFRRAEAYLSPPSPALMAIGGFSGTGKSCQARALAPHLGPAPGARIVRTDALRKGLAGIDPHDRLPPSGYSPAATDKTYNQVYADARQILLAGHSAICDGVFANPRHRQILESLARDLKVPFVGIWLNAPLDTRVGRIHTRVHDISDATEPVARQQSAVDPGPMSWHQIDAADDLKSTTQRIRQTLRAGWIGEL